jgi:hypothetical protein
MRRFEKKSVPRGAKLGWWTVGNLGRCATLLYPKIAYGGRGWAETSESIVWSLRTSLEACEFWSRETWMLEDLGCWKIFSQALPLSIGRQNDRVGDVASMMSGSTQRTTEEFFPDLARTLEGDSDKDACVGKENGGSGPSGEQKLWSRQSWRGLFEDFDIEPPQYRTLTKILFASCSCLALTGSCGPCSCFLSEILCCGLGAFQRHFPVPGENGVLFGQAVFQSHLL